MLEVLGKKYNAVIGLCVSTSTTNCEVFSAFVYIHTYDL